MISEVVDHAVDASAKYVEFCNRGSTDVGLQGLVLARYSNGGTSPSDIVLDDVVLAPGDSYVLAGNEAQFTATYGFAPDQSSGGINGNGDDAYVLANGLVTLDIYGEIGVDGTDQPWEYLDAVAQRVETVEMGSVTWSASEWVITPGADASNPGDCSAVEPPVDTDTDVVDTDTDVPDTDTDVVDTDTDVPDTDTDVVDTDTDVPDTDLPGSP